MNAIFRDAMALAEKLSPEDQKVLAAWAEQRAHELYLNAEVQKGVASLDRGEEIPSEQVFSELLAVLSPPNVGG